MTGPEILEPSLWDANTRVLVSGVWNRRVPEARVYVIWPRTSMHGAQSCASGVWSGPYLDLSEKIRDII